MPARSPARRLLLPSLVGLALLVGWLAWAPGRGPALEPSAAGSAPQAQAPGADALTRAAPEGPPARAAAEPQPTADGVEAQAAQAPGPGGRTLVGALRAPAGGVDEVSYEIVPGTDFSMGLGLRRGSTGRHALELGEGGAFRVRVTEPGPFEAVVFRARSAGGEPLEAYALLPEELPEGETDLGALPLGSLAALAVGRVVDGSGRGIPGATVHVHWRRYGAPRPDADPGAPPPYSFHPVEGADTRSGADGSFVVTAHSPGDELRLSVQHPGFLEAVVECRRGDRGVDLVLRRAAGLRGTVLVDPWVPLEKLSVAVEQATWNPRKRDVRPDAGGAFGWDALDPEPTLLRVLCADVAEPLVELRDLALLEGQVLEDPRLSPLDLRGALVLVELSVRGPGGEPLPDARAVPLGAPLPQDAAWSPGGVVRVLGRAPGLDLRVFAPSFRAVELRDVRGQREVTLGRGIRLEVELDLREPLAAGESLSVLIEDDGGRYPVGLFEAPVRPDHTATLYASYPGPHRLSLWLTDRQGQVRLSGAAVEARVAVDEGSEGQRVQLACDAEDLARGRRREWLRR